MNTPWFSEHLPPTVARAIAQGANEDAAVQRLVRRQDEADRIAKAIQDATSGVGIAVDLGAAFKRADGATLWRHEGRLLFRDGGHLSVSGSMFVAPYLKTALESLMRAEATPSNIAPPAQGAREEANRER